MSILEGTIENCPVCHGTHINPEVFYIYPDELKGAMVQCPNRPGMHYFSLYRHEVEQGKKPELGR